MPEPHACSKDRVHTDPIEIGALPQGLHYRTVWDKFQHARNGDLVVDSRLATEDTRNHRYTMMIGSLASICASSLRAGGPGFWNNAGELPLDDNYITGLVDDARGIAIGKTWLLDKATVMLELRTGVDGFEAAQRTLDTMMPGKWDRQVSSDGRLFIYKRLR